MRQRIKNVIDKWRLRLDGEKKSTKSNMHQDTIIYPLLQYGAIDINYEHTLLTHLFTAQVTLFKLIFSVFLPFQNNRLCICLASGYFNLINAYSHIITHIGTYKLRLLAASPEVC
jgi:hypothetical protein